MIKYIANKIFLTFCVLACVGLIRCSQVAMSGGTEDGNPSIVAGVIIDSDGFAEAGVRVSLIPVEYNPFTDAPLSDSHIDTTDISGGYVFTVRENGTGPVVYNILAHRYASGKRMLHRGILVEGDTIDNLLDTIKKPGVVKIVLPKSEIEIDGYVYIPGTDIYKKVKSSIFYLDLVPVGVTPQIKYVNAKVTKIISDSMNIESNDTAIQASVLLISKFKYNVIDTVSIFIAEKLKEFGLSVKIVTDSNVSFADTAGISAIIFSPTAELNRLENIFRSMPLPLLNMEFMLLRYMGMTGPVEYVDFGRLQGGMECDIFNPPHSIAGNLSDKITMYSDSCIAEWGKPGTGAQKIAVLTGSTADSSTIFCYEKGAEMVDMKAPAKRGAFLLQSKSTYKLTDDGWYIFRNMIMWLFE